MNAPAKPHTHGPHYWFDEGSPVPLHARVLAALYGGMTGLRRGLYERKLLRRSHPGVPVIVVGNLIAGGAGKTPLTVALVERLRTARAEIEAIAGSDGNPVRDHKGRAVGH